MRCPIIRGLAGCELRGVSADPRCAAVHAAVVSIDENGITQHFVAADHIFDALDLDRVFIGSRIDAAVAAEDAVRAAGMPRHRAQVPGCRSVEGRAAVVYIDGRVIGTADVDRLNLGDLAAVDHVRSCARGGSVAHGGSDHQVRALGSRHDDALHAGLCDGRAVIIVIIAAAVKDPVGVKPAVFQIEHELQEGIVCRGRAAVAVAPGSMHAAQLRVVRHIEDSLFLAAAAGEAGAETVLTMDHPRPDAVVLQIDSFRQRLEAHLSDVVRVFPAIIAVCGVDEGFLPAGHLHHADDLRRVVALEVAGHVSDRSDVRLPVAVQIGINVDAGEQRDPGVVVCVLHERRGRCAAQAVVVAGLCAVRGCRISSGRDRKLDAAGPAVPGDQVPLIAEG